jgi:ABC-type branched-subunit amino acid transport system substrate-binding protein
MKKIGMWLAVVLAIVTVTAVFSLSGCTAADPEVVVETVTETVVETVTETVEVMADTTPITIGHGTFWTGPFAFVGPPFAAALDFTLEFVNQNPPLGAPVRALHSDEGTIGEQQWVMRDVDSNKVDIILNVGFEYLTYRDWLLDYVATNNRPLMPSVHGGSISPIYGGTAEEPLFRGSPQDIDQAVVAVVRAMDLGAKTCVVMGAEYDSAQQQKDIAAEAAEIAGMEVLDVVDYELEKTYRAEVTAIQALNPDAILLFGGSTDAGLIVKTAAELGMSTIIIGPTDLQFPEFVAAATMDAINQHIEVNFVGFTYQDGPAWDYYSEAWNGNPTYAAYNDASDSYTMQYYDLINCTMLAIKQSGSLDVADWAAAMHSVANSPGVEVYNYLEGVAAIEAGEEINYIGASGQFDYTATGVVDGSYSASKWVDAETVERVDVIPGSRVIEISSQLAVNQ